ncbi:hypothetical protein HDV00_009423 [Rhizophlyctis rosea]|nr:hypothetical protein HDV00_009423 [Rhizophlyctis rosea]
METVASRAADVHIDDDEVRLARSLDAQNKVVGTDNQNLALHLNAAYEANKKLEEDRVNLEGRLTRADKAIARLEAEVLKAYGERDRMLEKLKGLERDEGVSPRWTSTRGSSAPVDDNQPSSLRIFLQGSKRYIQAVRPSKPTRPNDSRSAEKHFIYVSDDDATANRTHITTVIEHQCSSTSRPPSRPASAPPKLPTKRTVNVIIHNPSCRHQKRNKPNKKRSRIQLSKTTTPRTLPDFSPPVRRRITTADHPVDWRTTRSPLGTQEDLPRRLIIALPDEDSSIVGGVSASTEDVRRRLAKFGRDAFELAGVETLHPETSLTPHTPDQPLNPTKSLSPPHPTNGRTHKSCPRHSSADPRRKSTTRNATNGRSNGQGTLDKRIACRKEENETLKEADKALREENKVLKSEKQVLDAELAFVNSGVSKLEDSLFKAYRDAAALREQLRSSEEERECREVEIRRLEDEGRHLKARLGKIVRAERRTVRALRDQIEDHMAMLGEGDAMDEDGDSSDGAGNMSESPSRRPDAQRSESVASSQIKENLTQPRDISLRNERSEVTQHFT